MKRIAVLGSGGDAPGMNACVRAVVRSSVHRDLEVMGVRDGYGGLIAGELHPLSRHDVSNIIQRGGIFLGAGRSQEFMTPEGRAKAAAALREHGVDGLVALGGDGTLRGAIALNEEWGTPVVVVPCTIDNDAPGTDLAIGFDTAVNTALEAVDRHQGYGGGDGAGLLRRGDGPGLRLYCPGSGYRRRRRRDPGAGGGH